MIRRFIFVCLECNKRCLENKTEYEGKVNYNYTPTSPGVYRIDVHCFTCGTDDMEILDMNNPDNILPVNQLAFEKMMKNKARTQSNEFRAD